MKSFEYAAYLRKSRADVDTGVYFPKSKENFDF